MGFKLSTVCFAVVLQASVSTATASIPVHAPAPPAVGAHDLASAAPAGGHGNCSADHSIGHEVHNFAQFIVFPYSLAMMMAIIVGVLLHRCETLNFLPESLLVIIVGAVMGFGFNSVHTMDEHDFTNKFEMVLNFFCLPLIIFESGWSLRVRDFLSQLPYIIIYAVLGTVISWLVVAFLIHYTGDAGWHGITDWRTAMCFSSLISAVDPVASLATYSSLKVEPLLNIVVFGESTINDAVAIAIFGVLNDNSIMNPALECDLTHESITVADRNLLITWNIFRLLVGSTFVGIFLGACVVLVMRVVGMHHVPPLAMLFCLMSAFFTFSLSEAFLGLSGIIAVLFMGIMLGEYARPHLSISGSLLFSFLVKRLTTLADMMVFLLAGVSAVFFDNQGFYFGFSVMLFCIVGRAAAIFPLSVVVNALKRCSGRLQRDSEEEMHFIDFGRQVLMVWGGLRGGIAIVLVLKMGDWVNVEGANQLGAESRNAMRNGTFLLVMVFLLIFGSTTEMMLKFFNIPMGGEVPDREEMFEEEAVMAERRCIAFLRESIFKPVLVGEDLVGEMQQILDVDAKAISVEDVLYEAADSKYWRKHTRHTTEEDRENHRKAETNRHALCMDGEEESLYEDGDCEDLSPRTLLTSRA